MRSALTALADVMACNHIELSFPDEGLRSLARGKNLRQPPDSETPAIIVVTGAGASVESEIPAGAKTYDLLRAHLRSIPEEYIQSELTRLSVQYRLGRNDFETRLLALSRFDKARLLAEMGRVFQRRFYASNTYEVLAHLLKHRFIDAVINFNFDELLDQAIEDEVGLGNYHMVVADGDIPDDLAKLQDDNRRFRLPLYVKPHGTASNRSTLRFTREDYFLLPDNLRALLVRLLSSKPCTLVLIGFSMKSVEFTAIAREAARSGQLDVFVIDKDPSRVLNRLPKKVNRVESIEVPDLLADWMANLWTEVEKRFEPGAAPRGMERHNLMSALFHDRVDVKTDEGGRLRHDSYLKDRTIIEIALSAAKAKGFVHVGQLGMSRAGRYFRHWSDHQGHSGDALTTLCKHVGLHQYGYSHDTLKLDSGPQPADWDNELIVDPVSWREREKERLIDATVGQLSIARRREIRKPETMAVFEAALDYMYEHDEVEVITPHESPYRLLFEQPVGLGSLAAMKLFTREILASDWDQMFCIAESGKWLEAPDTMALVTKKHDRRLCAIVADRVHVGSLQARIEESGMRADFVRMPWWLHNQHMTLLIRKGRPTAAVYFERRMRSHSIAPVGLRGRADLEIALATFLAYWTKARRFNDDPGRVFVHVDDTLAARTELLAFRGGPA